MKLSTFYYTVFAISTATTTVLIAGGLFGVAILPVFSAGGALALAISFSQLEKERGE